MVKHCIPRIKSSDGFSLMALIIVMAILGIAAGMAELFMSQLREIRSERLSRDEMILLKEAMVGRMNIFSEGGRAGYGYISNMGKVPDSLEDLYKKGSQPVFSFNSSVGIGAGWAGPYITPLVIENLDGLKEDVFGNAYEYTIEDGNPVSARIRSLGPDGISGTSDDRVVDILKNEIFSTLSGYVVDSGGVGQSDVTVFFNKPVDGVVTSISTITDANGAYSFPDVPFGVGVRTMSVSSGLAMVVGTAKSGGNKITVEVQNNSKDDISITSIKAVYNITGYYEILKVGGIEVYKYNGGAEERGESGDIKTFSDQTVGGSGEAVDIKIVRVERSTQVVPNLVLGALGGKKLIEYLDFKDALTGSGDDVDMTGANVTLTFSDGSEITFITTS